MQGYVTEKLFGVWSSPVIPIYYGAPDVEDFVPAPHSYINAANFSSFESLAECIFATQSKSLLQI